VSTEHTDPAPPQGVDLDRPSVARVYDYFLGGTANWSVDRRFGDQIIERVPLVRDLALANRVFLNRVVRHLVHRGVRQFLDVGAGVPTAGNTHQVADELDLEEGRTPTARVVYVDNEPVAVAHAELLLDKEGDDRRHAVIAADLREPDDLWRKARETELLDPSEPIALLLIAVLHVQQTDPTGVDIGPDAVARFRKLLPAGSYLAVSHATDDGVPPDLVASMAAIKQMYDASSSSNVVWRPRADIETLLGDFRLVEPGWSWTSAWHPEETGPGAPTITFPEPNYSVIWAGLGQKPG
jgi:S-adenosyl methyltransferase